MPGNDLDGLCLFYAGAFDLGARDLNLAQLCGILGILIDVDDVS